MASEQELSDFLKSVEKRAFKRAAWQTRDDEAALDIVQDSMLKLATHYGDKPAAELPLLFQRILGNQTLDWFRRQKTRDAHFANAHDLLDGAADEDGGPDALEILQSLAASGDALAESAEQAMSRAEVLQHIENALQALPARQREAFLLRYWEEMDVAETAAVMGGAPGSVKTHCSRAVQALARLLHVQGITL